ncbi:MAG: hypothetical protein JWM85_2697, partial [Acidimicrobiaceae bacterium]|nr:hypothetical protein [Acidimicrobiaceae bacterium]
SKQLSILWTRWGWRAFVGMFIGLGFLGLSDIRALHWVGVAGAICSALLVVIMFVMSWKFHSRYVRARREEGADPSI